MLLITCRSRRLPRHKTIRHPSSFHQGRTVYQASDWQQALCECAARNAHWPLQ